MKISYVEATDIPDAWFQCISKVLDVGFKYEIQQGAYVGQTRLEFDWVTVLIKYSYMEPYDLMLPKIPQHLGIPDPVASGYIDQYLPYLMTGEKKENEDYTYGERITHYSSNDLYGNMSWTSPIYLNQVERFIDILRETPNTNQAILQISHPLDCVLDDPPCLRHIDMRIKDNKLIFYPYFRSWSLWNGFPANLAVIAVLQKFMADEVGVEIGEMCASSKGLHIYGYVEELAKLRVGK